VEVDCLDYYQALAQVGEVPPEEVDYLVAEEVPHLLVAEEVHLQAQLLLDLVLLMHPYSLYN
jgi:hypothetical protein